MACQELLGNKRRLCWYSAAPATLAPAMLTGVLQRANVRALLIAIYHAFPVCKCLLLETEYEMGLERVIAVQGKKKLKKKRRRKVTSPEGTQGTSELHMGNLPLIHFKATTKIVPD